MTSLTALPRVAERFRAVAEVTSLPATQEALIEQIGKFDAFITPLNVQTDRAVLDRAPRLKFIFVPSTGMDHIDLELAAERGIKVHGLREERALLNRITATAELAWALLLALVRHLPWAFDSVRSGSWDSAPFQGRQLAGKTLGVVGYGRLGHMVAEYGRAFRMRVLICNNKPRYTPDGVEQVSFDRLLAESDVVSIHVHLTEQNHHLFDAPAFGKMKKGAILINTSRGAVIDDEAFLAVLGSGKLAGAGVDVLVDELRNDIGNHPLIQYAKNHDNLLISPHIGGVTSDSQAIACEGFADRIVELLREGKLKE